MFTFSSGFEAATLKIPNKDSTAYGANAPSSGMGNGSRNGAGAYQLGYPYGIGANDPYNLVTVNQGGVIVDGRDGTTSSWPSAPDAASDLASMGLLGSVANSSAQGQGGVPPRKQIIGFAKFRSRAEALAARDLLQGRRVDIEKGAVLKAEMAKKNLHTKRGVGPLGSLSSGSNGVSGSVGGVGMGVGGNMSSAMSGVMNDVNGVAGGLVGMSDNGGMGGMSMLGNGGNGIGTLSMRDREIGAINAMGLGSQTTRRERERMESQQYEEEQEREARKRRELGSASMSVTYGNPNTLSGAFSSRGARERLEEDERERERRRKEKEERSARLRAGSSAMYESFQGPASSVSVPLRNVTVAGSSLLSPTEVGNSYSFSASAQPFTPQDYNGGSTETWSAVPGASSRSKLAGLGINGTLRALPIGVSSSGNSSSQPTRPPSSHQSSPSDANNDATFTQSLASRDNLMQLQHDVVEPVGDPNSLHSLNSHSSMSSTGSRSRPYSPVNDHSASSQGQHAPTLNLHAQVQHLQQQQQNQAIGAGAVPMQGTSSSSMSGSRSSSSSGFDGDVVRAMGSMEISSQQGTISPQLPSPNSGASSGTRGNASDQNPPVSTICLYMICCSVATRD